MKNENKLSIGKHLFDKELRLLEMLYPNKTIKQIRQILGGKKTCQV